MKAYEVVTREGFSLGWDHVFLSREEAEKDAAGAPGLRITEIEVTPADVERYQLDLLPPWGAARPTDDDWMV
ncbi:MAG TPA: hypothetical protein VNK91_01855 [Burkholderiaceae bacterium]|nr:hypothetical protein [Burkholderiaceae bacterium]